MRYEITSPCPLTLTADDRCGTSRFCHQCSKKVYHLSNMTEEAAQGVVDRKAAGEDVCVSFVGDRQGNVIFKRVAASLVLAVGMFQSAVALADGAPISLVQTDVPAPAVSAAPALSDDTTVDLGQTPQATDGAVVDTLADVSDDNCDKKLPLVQADTATGTKVEPEYLMWDGG